MIKFAHISDIHLGYTSGKKVDPETKINLRENDGYEALNEVVEQIISDKDTIDFVLCTGDFFHSPNPNMRTIVYAQRILRKLTTAKIPFYCLAGNHDSTDTKKDIPSSVVLHAPESQIYSYSDPYKIITIKDNLLLHLVSHHGYTAQKDTMQEVKPVDGKINILCTHGSCYDDVFGGILHTDAEPREIVIPENVLNLNWSYILLGHIHNRGWVHSTDGLTDTSGKKIFYAGSLFRRGFSDNECKLGRGWTKWEVNETTYEMNPVFYHIKQRSQVELTLDCKGKEILQIEDELEELFKKVDFELIPILRAVLIDISTINRTQLNWKRFEKYTSKCLSFTTKFSTAQEVRKVNISGAIFSFDLLDAYKSYWNEVGKTYNEKDRDLINDVNKTLLKRGQDKILESSK